jgi:hypothetical protein
MKLCVVTVCIQTSNVVLDPMRTLSLYDNGMVSTVNS